MPAKLITKEEIIDLKNCFAFGKAILDNYKFYHRNSKFNYEWNKFDINWMFEVMSYIFSIGWTTKPYEWFEDQIKNLKNNKRLKEIIKRYYKDTLKRAFIKIEDTEEYQWTYSILNFIMWFITAPYAKGYKLYLNNNVSDEQAIKYMNKYLKIVEHLYSNHSPGDFETKYWKIVFRENNPFNKTLFNK